MFLSWYKPFTIFRLYVSLVWMSLWPLSLVVSSPWGPTILLFFCCPVLKWRSFNYNTTLFQPVFIRLSSSLPKNSWDIVSIQGQVYFQNVFIICFWDIYCVFKWHSSGRSFLLGTPINKIYEWILLRTCLLSFSKNYDV